MEYSRIDFAQLSALSGFSDKGALSIFCAPCGGYVLCFHNDQNASVLVAQRGQYRRFKTLDSAANVAVSAGHTAVFTYLDLGYTPLKLIELLGGETPNPLDVWRNDSPLAVAVFECGRTATVSVVKEGRKPSDYIGKTANGSHTEDNGDKELITGVIVSIM